VTEEAKAGCKRDEPRTEPEPEIKIRATPASARRELGWTPQVSGHCRECGQELIEIDNRGERLLGCLTCNLWAAEGKEHWVRLSEEDLRALQELRHKGSR
jgi:hypothetical protein